VVGRTSAEARRGRGRDHRLDPGSHILERRRRAIGRCRSELEPIRRRRPVRVQRAGQRSSGRRHCGRRTCYDHRRTAVDGTASSDESAIGELEPRRPDAEPIRALSAPPEHDQAQRAPSSPRAMFDRGQLLPATGRPGAASRPRDGVVVLDLADAQTESPSTAQTLRPGIRPILRAGRRRRNRARPAVRREHLVSTACGECDPDDRLALTPSGDLEARPSPAPAENGRRKRRPGVLDLCSLPRICKRRRSGRRQDDGQCGQDSDGRGTEFHDTPCRWRFAPDRSPDSGVDASPRWADQPRPRSRRSRHASRTYRLRARPRGKRPMPPPPPLSRDCETTASWLR